MRETFTIGDLSRATKTKVETIRSYERIDLLPRAARTSGNYRAYSGAHRDRLSFIRRARALGFSLDQVRQLLALSEHSQRPCDEVDRIARADLDHVDAKIADLTALRRELNSLAHQCQGTINECRIIEALSPQPASRQHSGLPPAGASLTRSHGQRQ